MSPFPTLPPMVPGRVSVALPAWNSEATVASAVESCLAQTWPDVEVVVVDDGSTDDTARVLASFGDRIRLVRQANGGVGAARSAAVAASTGEFVAWMDNDDIMDPDRLRIGVAVLRALPDVQLVCSDFSAFRSPDIEIEASHAATYYSAIPRLGGIAAIFPERFEFPVTEGAAPVTVRVGDVYDMLVEGNFIHPPTVLVRRAALERAGPFDPSLRIASEYDVTVRVARQGRVAYVERPLLRYRRSDSQLSSYTTAAGRIDVETIAVLERLRRDDPGLYERLRDTFRRRFALAHVRAAAGIGTRDRRRAFGLLLASLRYGPAPARFAKAFAKIVVPPSWVAAVKRALQPNSRDTVPPPGAATGRNP